MDEFKLQDVNGNAADPLKKNVPNNGRELFERFSQQANGFDYEAVVAAASNLLLNVIRQKCPTSREAQNAFDELATKLKAVLVEQHYLLNGQRRSVFAFHQEIKPDLLDTRKGRRHN